MSVENTAPSTIATTLLALAAAMMAPATVGAQQLVSPDQVEQSSDPAGEDDEIDDQTGLDDEEDDEQEADDSPFPTFEDVEVQRVRPDEVPDYEPGLPEGSSSDMDTTDLPESVGDQQMREISHHVASSTAEIIAVETPPDQYQQTRMVYRGHALWISPHTSGADPVLVATADWLEEADAIYAIDGEVGEALSDSGLEIGETDPQPVEDFQADAGQVVDRHRDQLVQLEIDRASQHVNLAVLAGAGDTSLATPDQGLVLHDMDAVMPGALFGFSPAIGADVVPVGYADSEELEREYSFYFLVTFQAILGAPLIGSNGRLVGITALRHPSNPEQTLAIPPGAIHAFLGTGRAAGSSDDDD